MAGDLAVIAGLFGADRTADRPMDNRFDPQELVPRGRAWVVHDDAGVRTVAPMAWDVLGGGAKFPMTNVRRLDLPQWRRLAERPANRCLIPLTEFCEWTPEKDPAQSIKGEMWFAVTDQPVFAVAGFWQETGQGNGFAMVTCDPNAVVAPIHPKAMIVVLEEADWDRWLTGDADDVAALQRPYDPNRMTVRGPVFPTRGKGR